MNDDNALTTEIPRGSGYNGEALVVREVVGLSRQQGRPFKRLSKQRIMLVPAQANSKTQNGQDRITRSDLMVYRDQRYAWGDAGQQS